MTWEILQITSYFSKIFSPERLTALATVIYMLFTGWLILESRKARKLQESPQLDIFVKRSEEWWSKLDLIIKNSGFWCAYDIKLESNKDFNLFDREDKYTLRNLGYFKNWISFLPANGKRENFFTYMTTNYEEKIKRKIEIKATYKDKYWNKQKNKFLIDLSEFEDTMLPQEPPIYKISKNIEKIQKDFHSIITWFNQLKVLTQTKKEKKVEDLERLEQDKKDLETMKNT